MSENTTNKATQLETPVPSTEASKTAKGLEHVFGQTTSILTSTTRTSSSSFHSFGPQNSRRVFRFSSQAAPQFGMTTVAGSHQSPPPVPLPKPSEYPNKRVKLSEEPHDSTSSSDGIPSKALTRLDEVATPSPYLKYFDQQDLQAYNINTQASQDEEASEIKLTPIFSSRVWSHLETLSLRTFRRSATFTQYGLIGLLQSIADNTADTEALQVLSVPAEDRMLFGNVEVPWSSFICGSQGAGKSHTLSCLLENALLQNSKAGVLPDPLSGLIFHYDVYASASSLQVCEAAYLCSSGIPVTVLVCPSNIWDMTKIYENLPGLPSGSPKPKILPLYLSERQLDIDRILKLMSVDDKAENVPLYMDVVLSILREMAMEGKGSGLFSYADFKNRLAQAGLIKAQEIMLRLRLQLLESFLEPSNTTRSTRPAPASTNIWEFKKGTVTIVDLSDPFVSSNEACSLFNICLSIFLESRGDCGQVIALDEAHKFLAQSGEARALTENLTSIIRQQRHTGTRVIISTQEPTLSPELIDLSNATFVHRFLSPAWYEVLKKHVAGVKKYDSTMKNSLFETIVSLKTGEALLFCPTAVVSTDDSFDADVSQMLADGYMKLKVRNRLSADGGKSILASDRIHIASGPPTSTSIPMHVVTKPNQSVENGSKRKYGPTVFHPPAPTTAPPSGPSGLSSNNTNLVNNFAKTAQATAFEKRLSDEVTRQVYDAFYKRNWKSMQNIGFRELYVNVAIALKMPRDAIANSIPYAAIVQGAAQMEIDRIRAG